MGVWCGGVLRVAVGEFGVVRHRLAVHQMKLTVADNDDGAWRWIAVPFIGGITAFARYG